MTATEVVAEAIRTTREWQATAAFGVPEDAVDQCLAALAEAAVSALHSRGILIHTDCTYTDGYEQAKYEDREGAEAAYYLGYQHAKDKVSALRPALEALCDEADTARQTWAGTPLRTGTLTTQQVRDILAITKGGDA
jgi:hypothetical protein